MGFFFPPGIPRLSGNTFSMIQIYLTFGSETLGYSGRSVRYKRQFSGTILLLTPCHCAFHCTPITKRVIPLTPSSLQLTRCQIQTRHRLKQTSTPTAGTWRAARCACKPGRHMDCHARQQRRNQSDEGWAESHW